MSNLLQNSWLDRNNLAESDLQQFNITQNRNAFIFKEGTVRLETSSGDEFASKSISHNLGYVPTVVAFLRSDSGNSYTRLPYTTTLQNTYQTTYDVEVNKIEVIFSISIVEPNGIAPEPAQDLRYKYFIFKEPINR